LNRLWQFFKSVKLTVVLLLTLAGTSVIGTLIPQNQAPSAYFNSFGPFLYRLFHVLGIFDMYHSWWFQGFMVMLALNIIVCSIDRLSATWKIIFVKAPVFRRARFQKTAARQVFTDPRPPDQLVPIVRDQMARAFGRIRHEEQDDGYRLYAERWRWSRLGVYGVHLSVVLLLAGGLIGSIFGFEGSVSIAEGESATAIRLRQSGLARDLDFTIRCDKFTVSFYDTGAPREFRSDLTIIEQGREVLKKAIIVNDPLHYKGISIFQSSYGTLPARGATLVFTSKETGMRYPVPVKIGDKVDIPEQLGTFVLEGFRSDARFRGHPVGDAFAGRLVPLNGGEGKEILLPLHFPSFDRMRQGDVVVSVEKLEQGYYTGLQVSRDPGVWVVYTGFVLMLVGCFITFFMAHQQICLEVTPHASGSTVTVSGKANKNPLGMERKVERLAVRLAGGDASILEDKAVN
jgi:cytochrome c biogenesis protein